MRLKMARVGQLQSMEPIIVMVFLAIIVGIMLIFYFRISDAQGAQDVRSQANVQDLAAIKRLAALPEIACPRPETAQAYCIDKYKALAFAAAMENSRLRQEYYPLFGQSRINITIITLQPRGQEQLTIYDSLGDASRVRTSVMYTTVYDPSADQSAGERKFAMVTFERGSS